MIVRHIFIRILFITFTFILLGSAQRVNTQDSNRRFDSGTEITIDYLPENDFYYIHSMDEGITLYSLAQVFQVSLDALYEKSSIHPETPINKGKIVKIPLKKNLISTTIPKDKKYLKLLYIVKKKQTYYSLSRDLGLTVDEIKTLNRSNNDSLNEGMTLVLGYYILEEKSQDTSSQSINKYYLSDVLGFWDKNSTSEALFVLHNEAKIGSLMDIHNPMLRRHTKAKVIGRIPNSTYPEEIEIILSSKCAKIMGILDTRFKVNIKYEK